MLGLVTTYLLSVLIVLEYYPASDETKIQWGPLVLGVATNRTVVMHTILSSLVSYQQAVDKHDDEIRVCW